LLRSAAIAKPKPASSKIREKAQQGRQEIYIGLAGASTVGQGVMSPPSGSNGEVR
jgi:hypothetical protein